MPKYRIETTVQQRRVYIVEASNKHVAQDLIDENGYDYIAAEEDLSEEVDSVVEIAVQTA